MQTISVRRANELGDAARSAVESLLGRTVADEEHVTVMAYPAQTSENGPDRKAAVRDLVDDLDSLAASASQVRTCSLASAHCTASRRPGCIRYDGAGGCGMVTIAAKGRVKDDGTLDLHVTTGLSETDAEVLLVLEPLVLKSEKAASGEGGWPEGYFEKTFGSFRQDPITYEPPPQFETRDRLR